MAFGLMGGLMQAQGHVQLALRILGLRPEPAGRLGRAALARAARPRRSRSSRPSRRRHARALAALGHEIIREPLESHFAFGGSQAILRVPGGYIAGSDPRKDGQAVGF